MPVLRERGLGRVVVKDDRDKRFAIQPKQTDRTSRYWDDDLILNQGSTPSCVGHAWSHWLSAPPIEQLLLPMGIYSICQFYDEWEGEDYEGTSVRAGAKILKMLGVISEYRWASSIDSLVYTVLEEAPVVVGTDWYEGMDNGGILKVTGALLGGHAWLIDGIDTTRGIFRMKNSWGTSWGDNGRAWIQFSEMEKLLNRDGEVCLGVEYPASVNPLIPPPPPPDVPPPMPEPTVSWWKKIWEWILSLFR